MGLKRRVTELFTPDVPVRKEPTTKQSVISFLKSSWLNIMWLFIPLSWALHFANVGGDTVIFVMCFLAIIPLAANLGYATEELALRTGECDGEASRLVADEWALHSQVKRLAACSMQRWETPSS